MKLKCGHCSEAATHAFGATCPCLRKSRRLFHSIPQIFTEFLLRPWHFADSRYKMVINEHNYFVTPSEQLTNNANSRVGFLSLMAVDV